MPPEDFRQGSERGRYPTISLYSRLPNPHLVHLVLEFKGIEPQTAFLGQPSGTRPRTPNYLSSTSRMTVQLCRPPKASSCLSHTQVLETWSHWGEENLWKHKAMLPLVSEQGQVFRNVQTLTLLASKKQSSLGQPVWGSGPGARLWARPFSFHQWQEAGTQPSPKEGWPWAAPCLLCLQKGCCCPSSLSTKFPSLLLEPKVAESPQVAAGISEDGGGGSKCYMVQQPAPSTPGRLGNRQVVKAATSAADEWGFSQYLVSRDVLVPCF